MDITPFVETLRRDLARAAEVGTDDVRAAAERLAAALDPAVRLAFMDALAQAAAEISAELEAGAVELRLKGREPVFVMVRHEGTTRSAPDVEQEGDDSESLARITLRLPEALKIRAEALAGRSGLSLNAWLVDAVRGIAAGEDHPHRDTLRGGRHRSKRRIQGWAR